MIRVTKTILKSLSYNINDVSLENRNTNQRINVNAKQIQNKNIFRIIYTVVCDAVRDEVAEEVSKFIVTFESSYTIDEEDEKKEKRDIAKFIVNEVYKTRVKNMVDDFYRQSELTLSSLDVDTF